MKEDSPQRHRDAEGLHAELSHLVVGAAITVHRALGPGLMESVYEECLAAELEHLGIPFARQVGLPLTYRGKTLSQKYVLDLLVDETIVVELKAVEEILPVHEAQLLTYLRLSRYQLGYLINFNVPVLIKGVVRRILT